MDVESVIYFHRSSSCIFGENFWNSQRDCSFWFCEQWEWVQGNSPFFMPVLQCRKKEQADCVHMISNKHVKGFNIVISSGKMVLSPVFHLVILTRWTNDHQTSASSIWISSFFIVYTKWYCSPQLCDDWIILCVETLICLLYFLSTSTLCHHNKK